MKTAAVYARVSTREQKKHGTSLDTQVEAMQAWAAQRGFETPYVLTEDWTGTQLDRPRLDEAKELARQGKIDALLVYSWDRLARDATHQHVLRYLFEEQWGVSIICITEPEMDELASMIYQTSIAMAAEIENYMRRERTTRGVRRAAIEKGHLPSGGQGLYGYIYSSKCKRGDGKRTINESEAQVVRLIFKWFVEDRLSIYRIAQRLESMGIRTEKGHNHWAHSTIQRMLTNPAYCGRTYAFRWKTVEPENPTSETRRRRRSSLQQTSRHSWVQLPEGTTPPIVSVELWEAAQQQLAKNRNAGRRARYPYLLKGMVRCYCGKAMIACTVAGKYRYYRCSAKLGVKPIHQRNIAALELEDLVWAEVETVLKEPSLIIDQLRRETQTGSQGLDGRIQEAKRALARLNLAERRLIRLYGQGEFDARKVHDEIDRVNAERGVWQQTLSELEERRRAKEELRGKELVIEEICERIRENLSSFEYEDKRLALEALQVQVSVGQAKEVVILGAIPVREMNATSRSWLPRR